MKHFFVLKDEHDSIALGSDPNIVSLQLNCVSVDAAVKSYSGKTASIKAIENGFDDIADMLWNHE